VAEALTEQVGKIVDAVRQAFEQMPPELAADIYDRGIMLTGGGALLRNLDQVLQERISIRVSVAEEPLQCVVKGCGLALEKLNTPEGRRLVMSDV
jgi:rod shape-determining protein MreB